MGNFVGKCFIYCLVILSSSHTRGCRVRLRGGGEWRMYNELYRVRVLS